MYIQIPAIISKYGQSGNANYTVPYLERSDKFKLCLYLDFSFNFTAPKPRYERIITDRDSLGRIA